MRPGNVTFSIVFTSFFATAVASTDPDVLAREIVGLPDSSSAISLEVGVGSKKDLKPPFSPGKAAWDSYEKQIGNPLRKWAAEEVSPPRGGTVFYPFSGPDFVTVAHMFPEADRYILVASQPAGEVVDLRTMSPQEAETFKSKFNAEWAKFGYLGFFRTLDL